MAQPTTKINWWRRNFQNGGGQIDTSRVAKIAITYFLVTTIVIVSLILLVVFIQFVGQWWAAKALSPKVFKLMLSNETITSLFQLVAGIAAYVGIDYRVGKIFKK